MSLKGAFDMEPDQVVSQEPLGSSSFAVVYGHGGVTINDENRGLVALSAAEAYNLLGWLYQYRLILRVRAEGEEIEQGQEQEMPDWAQR